MEKQYKFRELQSDDMFLMFSIISKIGVNTFKPVFDSESGKKLMLVISGKEVANIDTQKESVNIMLDVAQILLQKTPLIKKEIYSLLANTSNMTENEIKKMGICEFAVMLGDFVRKEEFPNFIKVVLKLFR